LAQQGFQISLRRAAVPNTLRIGCMGDLDETDMAAAVAAVGRVLREMRAPAPHRSSPQPPDVHMSR
jgi:aspartate aminotransferase-like enzyme